MKMNRAVGFVRLIRPVNCLMMGFAVIVGASLVMAPSVTVETIFRLLLGFVTAFALTGASMAINDYYDREIDMINEPNRPIPSGRVKPVESIIFAGFLTTLGLSAAVLANPSSLVIAVFSWLVSVTYVTRGKRTGLLGNFFVSACVAVSLVYGSFVVDKGFRQSIIIFATLAFLANTGREVTKGIVDVEGDKAKKIRTIAAAHGEKTATYVASAFLLSAVCLSFLPLHLGFVSFWFVPFVSVADLGFASSSVMLMRSPTRDNARRIKNLLLLWMTMCLIALAAGGSTI